MMSNLIIGLALAWFSARGLIWVSNQFGARSLLIALIASGYAIRRYQM
jgi:hypothetical protein